jgi:DNA-binding MarR family transcriptional regulator
MASAPPRNRRAAPGDAPGPAPELAALGQAFRRLYRAISTMRGRDTHLAGRELSHAQFELLVELDEQGELSLGELALAARIAPATVTQMLDPLVELGYVVRLRSDTDRRVVRASLTALGRRRVAAKRAAWRERWERALGDLSERELRTATRVLELLGEMFESEEPAEAPGDPTEPLRTGRKPV